MQTNREIPPNVMERVCTEISPREKIVWIDQQAETTYPMEAICMFIGGLFFLMLTTLIFREAILEQTQGKTAPYIMYTFCGGFMLMGILICGKAFLRRNNIAHTVYVITNKRALIMVSKQQVVKVRSFSPIELDNIQLIKRYSNETGTISIAVIKPDDEHDRDQEATIIGFENIRNVSVVESHLRKLHSEYLLGMKAKRPPTRCRSTI